MALGIFGCKPARLWRLALAFVVAAGCGRQDSTENDEATSQLSFQRGRIAFHKEELELGTPFNFRSMWIPNNNRCITYRSELSSEAADHSSDENHSNSNGDKDLLEVWTEPRPPRKGQIVLKQVSSFEKFRSALNIGADVGIELPHVAPILRSSFLSENRKSSFALAWVLKGTFVLGKLAIIDDAVDFAPAIKKLLKKKIPKEQMLREFGERCGDGMIYSKTRGAFLIASLKLNVDQQSKEKVMTLGAKAKVQSFGDINTTLNKLSKEYKIEGTIDVNIYQEGPNIENLASLFGREIKLKTGDRILSGIGRCELKDGSHNCSNVINAISQYAKRYVADLGKQEWDRYESGFVDFEYDTKQYTGVDGLHHHDFLKNFEVDEIRNYNIKTSRRLRKIIDRLENYLDTSYGVFRNQSGYINVNEDMIETLYRKVSAAIPKLEEAYQACASTTLAIRPPNVTRSASEDLCGKAIAQVTKPLREYVRKFITVGTTPSTVTNHDFLRICLKLRNEDRESEVRYAKFRIKSEHFDQSFELNRTLKADDHNQVCYLVAVPATGQTPGTPFALKIDEFDLMLRPRRVTPVAVRVKAVKSILDQTFLLESAGDRWERLSDWLRFRRRYQRILRDTPLAGQESSIQFSSQAIIDMLTNLEIAARGESTHDLHDLDPMASNSISK